MLALAAQALLALAVVAGLRAIVALDSGASAIRRLITSWLLALLFAHAIGWCWAMRAPSPQELIPALSREELVSRIALSALLGTAAFASIRASLAAAGLTAGLFFALIGAHAFLWMRVFQAWHVMGRFAGAFFGVLMPVAVAGCLLLAALILLHPECGGRRGRLAAAFLLLWAGPPRLALWRLQEAWGFGAENLSSDAGLPTAHEASRVSVAWLYPFAGRGYKLEEPTATAAGIDVSIESLEKLETYLSRRQFATVFARQALSALRQGWLFWWEADRALEAASMHRPKLLPPDYKLALGLLRAGPMTEQRYQALQDLAKVAAPRREGFEDVNTSQLIFEGFASSFARFGDEDPAREWLFRVDNLWPIYDKKIEVSPLETMHAGSVEGDLLVDGQPGSAVKVGLFLAPASSSTAGMSGYLSQSDFPDANGHFRFDSLAPGTYYLGLMGLPSQLHGKILNSPGLFELTPEVPSVILDPIRVIFR